MHRFESLEGATRGVQRYFQEGSAIVCPAMGATLVSKFTFTVTFPPGEEEREHVPRQTLRFLAQNQLADREIIETIDHLFNCARCFENYRRIRGKSTLA